jgi:pyrroloquinoline quinone (PQQ) biosynthesis protein C
MRNDLATQAAPAETPAGPSPRAGLEIIRARVAAFTRDMREHPIGRLIQGSRLPEPIAREFAAIQYVDSVLWVPMLALMKDRAKSPRLRKALTDNLLCEAGATHTSHITLCREFVESVGVIPSFGDYHEHSELTGHAVAVMNAVSALSEEELAGWILSAETLVPHMFAMFAPAYGPEIDHTYFREHMHIDLDEHSAWMEEAAAELLQRPGALEGLLSGIDLGARVALSVPDALYAKALRLNAARARPSGTRVAGLPRQV